MAMSRTSIHDTMEASEFVTLHQWMQERRDISALLSFYVPRRPQETLLQQLAGVLRSLDTGGFCRNNATTLVLTDPNHSV